MFTQKQKIAIYLLRRRQLSGIVQNKRKFWIQPAFLDRSLNGEYNRVFLPMKRLAEQGNVISLRQFYNYTRFELQAFKKLLNLLRNRLIINLNL